MPHETRVNRLSVGNSLNKFHLLEGSSPGQVRYKVKKFSVNSQYDLMCCPLTFVCVYACPVWLLMCTVHFCMEVSSCTQPMSRVRRESFGMCYSCCVFLVVIKHRMFNMFSVFCVSFVDFCMKYFPCHSLSSKLEDRRSMAN